MAYNTINKTHRCAGRLSASIQLKCKINLQLKPTLFRTNHKLPQPKVFRSWFDPIHAYKTINRSSLKSVNSGDCKQRELSRVTFQTRSKTADTLPIHILDKQILAFPILVQECKQRSNHQKQLTLTHLLNLIWWKRVKNNLHPLISRPLSGGGR